MGLNQQRKNHKKKNGLPVALYWLCPDHLVDMWEPIPAVAVAPHEWSSVEDFASVAGSPPIG